MRRIETTFDYTRAIGDESLQNCYTCRLSASLLAEIAPPPVGEGSTNKNLQVKRMTRSANAGMGVLGKTLICCLPKNWRSWPTEQRVPQVQPRLVRLATRCTS